MKVIDFFPVNLCPADHSGLSRAGCFNASYPAPVPIRSYSSNFEPKYCPQPVYESGYLKDFTIRPHFYRPWPILARARLLSPGLRIER